VPRFISCIAFFTFRPLALLYFLATVEFLELAFDGFYWRPAAPDNSSLRLSGSPPSCCRSQLAPEGRSHRGLIFSLSRYCLTDSR
jgi:hypothetical protein